VAFDYFGEHAGGPAPAHDPDAELLEAPRHPHGRLIFTMLTATAFFVASAWLSWGYRDLLRYAFGAARPPQELGDVTTLAPQDIAHNAFVSLSGITEHRGTSQRLARGVLPWREEYWFFRLLGSRGVFIETPADAERFGFATAVSVRGRALDPKRAPMYASFLARYQDRFPTAATAETRIIEVGVEPGEGRWPFVVLFLLIAVLGTLDVVSIVGYVRTRRGRGRGPGVAIAPPSAGSSE